MDFLIVSTEPAVADLEAIVRHMAEQDPEAAEARRLSLLESVEILSRFPFIGPSYERDPTGRAREIFCRPYRIFSSTGCKNRNAGSRSRPSGLRHAGSRGAPDRDDDPYVIAIHFRPCSAEESLARLESSRDDRDAQWNDVDKWACLNMGIRPSIAG